MTSITVLDYIQVPPEKARFLQVPFFFGSQPIVSPTAPRWGMTLCAAGSLRFRWNEQNEKRVLLSEMFPGKEIAPIELIHSKIVVEAECAADTKNIQADGIISKNRNIVPTVTVADCVPIFLFDTVSGAFGIFHSGWKGTGIVAEGVKLMGERFGTKPKNVAAAIGPHIGSCCYAVDEERAGFFKAHFGEKSVVMRAEKPMLSLTEANLFVLKNAGIQDENIVVSTDCTCCTKSASGKPIFGSFRREAAFLPSSFSNDEKSRAMTVQAAFIG